VRTEIAIAAGATPEAAKKIYDDSPCLDAKDVADALVYALGTPGHVQVCIWKFALKYKKMTHNLLTGP
jgi:NADP-dependent 3-hydroxy acid dehydrogenase YdfG